MARAGSRAAREIEGGSIQHQPTEFRSVTKTFRSARALRKVSFTIGFGERVALLGPNASGKTTVLNVLSDLQRPDGGEAIVFGNPPSHPAARRVLARSFEYPPLSDLLTVRGLARHMTATELDTDTLLRVLEQFGVGERTRLRSLSRGNIAKVGLAMVLARPWCFALLDEPTAHLDTKATQLVADLLRGRGECGFLLATHDIELATAVATRAVVLKEGVTVFDGPMTQLGPTATQVRARVLGEGEAPQ
jgi:ABC-type multidrug transport system ATPase subunit